MLVVPVVDHVLQQVAVAAGGNLLEEVAADHPASLGETAGFEVLRRPLHHVRLIEHDPLEVRIGAQDADQERSVPAADIDERVEGREVVGRRHDDRRHPGELGHRGVEVGRRVGILGHLGERIGGAPLAERRLARAHAVLELTPRALDACPAKTPP